MLMVINRAFIDKDSDKANELATEVLENYSIDTNQRILDLMCMKIGLDGSKKNNQEILRNLLKLMMDNESDFTITFRSLSDILLNNSDNFLTQFHQKDEVSGWINNWKSALNLENKNVGEIILNLNNTNPMYIPRNHQVQKAIEESYLGNFKVLEEMLDVLKNPFQENISLSHYSEAPSEQQRVTQTFCGT